MRPFSNTKVLKFYSKKMSLKRREILTATDSYLYMLKNSLFGFMNLRNQMKFQSIIQLQTKQHEQTRKLQKTTIKKTQ